MKTSSLLAKVATLPMIAALAISLAPVANAADSNRCSDASSSLCVGMRDSLTIGSTWTSDGTTGGESAGLSIQPWERASQPVSAGLPSFSLKAQKAAKAQESTRKARKRSTAHTAPAGTTSKVHTHEASTDHAATHEGTVSSKAHSTTSNQSSTTHEGTIPSKASSSTRAQAHKTATTEGTVGNESVKDEVKASSEVKASGGVVAESSKANTGVQVQTKVTAQTVKVPSKVETEQKVATPSSSVDASAPVEDAKDTKDTSTTPATIAPGSAEQILAGVDAEDAKELTKVFGSIYQVNWVEEGTRVKLANGNTYTVRYDLWPEGTDLRLTPVGYKVSLRKYSDRGGDLSADGIKRTIESDYYQTVNKADDSGNYGDCGFGSCFTYEYGLGRFDGNATSAADGTIVSWHGAILEVQSGKWVMLK